MEIKFGDVYTIRLLTGDEIVTKIVGKTDTAYKIEGVLGIGQGKNGPEMMPILSTTDSNASGLLEIKAIAMTFPTIEAVVDVYRESLGGVHIPEKKILMS